MKNTSNKRPIVYVVGILFLICYLLDVCPYIYNIYYAFSRGYKLSVNHLSTIHKLIKIMIPVGFLCRKPKVSGIGFFVSAIYYIWSSLIHFDNFAALLREGLTIHSIGDIYTGCGLGYIVWCLLLAVACFTPKHISRVLIFIAFGTMLLCVVIYASRSFRSGIIDSFSMLTRTIKGGLSRVKFGIGPLSMCFYRAIATLVWGFASIEAPAKVSPSAAAGVNTSPVERLIKLKALLDDGTISQEDFEQKKKEIIGL